MRSGPLVTRKGLDQKGPLEQFRCPFRGRVTPGNRQLEPVHNYTRCGLHDVAEIVARVRNLRDLLLVHRRGDVPIVCLDERGFAQYGNLMACFGNFERDIYRAGGTQRNIYYSALSSKAPLCHSQRVSGGCEKEEPVHSVSISFRSLGRPLNGVLDLDIAFGTTALL
jgi:hypothetical protein